MTTMMHKVRDERGTLICKVSMGHLAEMMRNQGHVFKFHTNSGRNVYECTEDLVMGFANDMQVYLWKGYRIDCGATV